MVAHLAVTWVAWTAVVMAESTAASMVHPKAVWKAVTTVLQSATVSVELTDRTTVQKSVDRSAAAMVHQRVGLLAVRWVDC